MTTLRALEARARAAVDAVKDDPEARYAMRERFYQRWGKGSGVGLGRSELDFMRWEIERGVLRAPGDGGSCWWRAVNERILYDAELAQLILDELPSADPGILSVRHWIRFMGSDDRGAWAKLWYRAHNASIVTGYALERGLARREGREEKIFVNMVLYRVLYAQAMVEGDALGELGAILANPRMPSVELLLEVPDYYPRHYPMTKHEFDDILGKGHSLPADVLDRVLDDLFMLPELEPLYAHCSGWLGLRVLPLFLCAGRPAYPDGAPGPLRPESPHPPIAPGDKRKIAILGGGLGSLSAAYELTSYEGWQERFDITVYQLGWRLGGKTASGWGPSGRIEERGIHIFQGWYNNAFRMVQDAFACMRANGLNTESPLQDWEDAFVPDDATLFTGFDRTSREWRNWPILFPYNDKMPGVAGDPPPVHAILGEALGLAAELLLGSPFAEPHAGPIADLLAKPIASWFFTPPWAKAEPGWWDQLRDRAASAAPSAAKHEHERWLLFAAELLKKSGEEPTLHLGPVEISALRAAVELLSMVVAFLRVLDKVTFGRAERLDHIVTLAEYGLANFRGILEDVYDERTHTFDFSRINPRDYREWLLSHGLPEDLRDCEPVRFIYCGCFHNQYQGEPGRLAADMAVRSLLVTVTYRGMLVWRLVGGTGGSLIAPLYKLLEHRGVKFAFFHDVQRVAWSETGRIEEMVVARQVDLLPGVPAYEPLVAVRGLEAFPSDPRYDQLNPEQARALRERAIDLESPWSGWDPVETRTLRRGIDFDEVINGIAVRATERICAELVKKTPQWQRLPDVRSTPTFGVQLWLRPTLDELGMSMPAWGMEEGAYPNSVIYADLMYSWTDTSCVLPLEGWPLDQNPGELSYFCGTWPIPAPLPPYSDHGFPARERQKLLDYTRTWLGENMGWFFPRAADGTYFDTELLVHPNDPSNADGLSGEARFGAQWFVVNLAPSDEYTLAWPGTDSSRIRADDTGFSNLYVAGDWTNFGLNIGHVEGAVTSGLVAAQVLLRRAGQQELRPIFHDIGET